MTTDVPKQMKTAISAGGVVYRRGEPGIEIVLCGRTSENLWALPKGTPDPGESLEETALREVAEETGLEVEIEGKVGSIRYEFRRRGEVFDKTVEHYLLRPVGGHLDGHDGEFDIVRWFPVAQALRLLTHDNDRHIVRQAVRLIEGANA
jgi:8-oxo-dGTP pyrophosphatase MutT (NUDIX family)